MTQVASGTTLSGAVVSADVELDVYGTVVGTTVLAGGLLFEWSGVASNTVVSGGAMLYVRDGTASNPTVLSGGIPFYEAGFQNNHVGGIAGSARGHVFGETVSFGGAYGYDYMVHAGQTLVFGPGGADRMGGLVLS